MKVLLVALFLLSAAVNAAEETSLHEIIASATTEDADLEALDAEDSGRRRRRRSRKSGKKGSGCSNNKVFDCSCGTSTSDFTDAQVFNQCQKGKGNLSGEQNIPTRKGKINGKQWGIAVWSEDYKNKALIPDGGNVCGKKNSWWSSKRSNKCKCGCFTASALGSNGGFSPAGGYKTSCLGICGPQCDGLKKGGDKRYPSILIHDACQANINSKKDFFKGGSKNVCADEGLHATTAAALSAATGRCG